MVQKKKKKVRRDEKKSSENFNISHWLCHQTVIIRFFLSEPETLGRAEPIVGLAKVGA